MTYLRFILPAVTMFTISCGDDGGTGSGGTGSGGTGGGGQGGDASATGGGGNAGTGGGNGGATPTTTTTTSGGQDGLSCSQTDCTASPMSHDCGCAETCEYCVGGDCTPYDFTSECVDGIAGLSCTCKVAGATVGTCNSAGTCGDDISIAAGNCCAQFLHP